MNSFKKALPIISFLCLSLFYISKSLYIPGCYAFDIFDDRLLTFPNLHIAGEILAVGQLPQINFFNNFGTPILGDALTYPFALQAMTHYIFSPPVAMTINRFLVCFITMTLLYIFYRHFFDRFQSSIASIICFNTPGFLWHSIHHHYQMALLFFTMLLILSVRKCTDKIKPIPFYVLGFFTSFLFILSVSINVVVIAFAMLLATSILFPQNHRWRNFTGSLVVLVSAAIATLPQTLSFVDAISLSTRINSLYNEYIPLGWRNVLLGAIAQVGEWKTHSHHFEFWIFTSLQVFASGMAGAYCLWKKTGGQMEGRLALLLGAVPMIAVVVLMGEPGLWNSIPLVRSTDITRIWWFSSVFLGLGIACFIAMVTKGSLSRLVTYLVLVLSITALVCAAFWGPWNKLSPFIQWGILIFCFGMVLYALFQDRWKSFLSPFFRRSVAISFIIVLAALYVLPTAWYRFGLSRPLSCILSFSRADLAGFAQENFLQIMRKNHRMAANKESIYGYDLTALYGDILGSGGRSIITHKEFENNLRDKELITQDALLSGYHFSPPWKIDNLRRLGIRYIISPPQPELKRQGWKETRGRNSREALCLYDDPMGPTPFYLMQPGSQDQVFLRNYYFKGNSAFIELPKGASGDLVATFINRPGWKVLVDAEPVKITPGTDGFMQVEIKPGDKNVAVSYNPYGWSQWAGLFLLGLALSLFGAFLEHRPCKNKNGI